MSSSQEKWLRQLVITGCLVEDVRIAKKDVAV
jgi:hypothetical protein